MDREEYFAWQRQEADRRHADAMRARDEAFNRARQDHNDRARYDVQRQQQAQWDHDATLRAQHARIQETNDRIRNERSASIRHQLEDHRHAQIRHYTNQIYGTNPHATTDPGRFPHSVDHGHWWQFWKR